MDVKTLGEKVRLFRNLKGYSQDGLAKSAGISQSQISYIEKSKNKKKCNEIIFKKICKGLEVSEDELHNFGNLKNNIFSDAVSILNKKDNLLLDAVFSDEKGITNLLNTIELLSKIIANYKLKLDECMKNNLLHITNKNGGGNNTESLIPFSQLHIFCTDFSYNARFIRNYCVAI